MKVPNTPTLLMASLALSSSTLAVPVEKHVAQSPNPAGGMSPRSPRLNDGVLAFSGSALDHSSVNMLNIPGPEQFGTKSLDVACIDSLANYTTTPQPAVMHRLPVTLSPLLVTS